MPGAASQQMRGTSERRAEADAKASLREGVSVKTRFLVPRTQWGRHAPRDVAPGPCRPTGNVWREPDTSLGDVYLADLADGSGGSLASPVWSATHADTRALPFARSPTAVANGAHALQFEPSSKQCTWLCSSGAVNEPGTAHAHPCWSASEPNLTLT